MAKLQVLIVEDDLSIAADLEATVTDIVPAVVVVKTSVAGTKKIIDEPLDFAFLDVDVTNGKTFEIAHMLMERRVPFAFVSGSSKEHIPPELRDVPFIPKPYDFAQIARILLSAPALQPIPNEGVILNP